MDSTGWNQQEVEEFHFNWLPFHVKKIIWTKLTLKQRLESERVCRDWQYPNMPYEDVKTLKMELETEPPTNWGWFRNAVQRTGANLSSLIFSGEHYLLRIPDKDMMLDLLDQCPNLRNFKVTNLTIPCNLLSHLPPNIERLHVEFVRFESQLAIAANPEEISASIRIFKELKYLYFYPVIGQRNIMRDLAFPQLESAVWKGNLRPDLDSLCNTSLLLEYLDISCSDYDAFRVLTRLVHLKRLRLSGTKIGDLDLSDLSRSCFLLEILDISFCQRITVFEPLANLPIRELIVTGCRKFNDEALMHLASGGIFRKLFVAKTAITLESVKILPTTCPILESFAFSADLLNPLLTMTELLPLRQLREVQIEGSFPLDTLAPFFLKRASMVDSGEPCGILRIEIREHCPKDLLTMAKTGRVLLVEDPLCELE